MILILPAIALIVSIISLVLALRERKRVKENLRFWESELERQKQLWREEFGE